MTDDLIVMAGQLLDDDAWVTMAELCRACRVSAHRLEEYVDYGVVAPVDCRSHPWLFQSSCISRVQIALRLERDLGVNPPGIALALELLEEVQKLRRL